MFGAFMFLCGLFYCFWYYPSVHYHFLSLCSRLWLKNLRTIRIRRASPTSTWHYGSTPRVDIGSKLEIQSLTSSARWVLWEKHKYHLFSKCSTSFYTCISTHNYRFCSVKNCHINLPFDCTSFHSFLGRFHTGSQSESLCSRAAPEAGESQSGHSVLPCPADPPCGVPHLRPHRGHWWSADSHVAGYGNDGFG